jgi:adenosylcobinamide-GDP ribazoletransferase
VRGALAFLSRLPVGGGKPAWEAFRRTPAAVPLAGYLLGGLFALPFAFGLAPATTAVLYLLAVYGLTGVTHVDGLADLADAAAVHRDPDDEAAGQDGVAARRAVMKDASTGVGGTVAVALTVVALALAAASLAPSAGGVSLATAGASGGAEPAIRAVATVVAAEVGAKAGMGVLACLGSPAHEGLGSRLVAVNGVRNLPGVALVAIPATLLLGGDGFVPLLAVVLAGPTTALALGRWARGRLGGVSGDVFGAANELGRLAGLHVGVIAWTL